MSDIINYGFKKKSVVRREREGGGGGGGGGGGEEVILLHPRQHFFSHIGTEQMLSCYRQVLGNIISVILGQSKCFLATVLGNIISVILGQSKCFLATDRYWVTLFQSYWDRANAFLLQTGTG